MEIFGELIHSTNIFCMAAMLHVLFLMQGEKHSTKLTTLFFHEPYTLVGSSDDKLI